MKIDKNCSKCGTIEKILVADFGGQRGLPAGGNYV